jgi:signal transduction histidine kinase
VIVSDTGIGMRKEDIPKAFEHFRQVDSSLSRKYEGSGLGLPLARELMEAHGGRLEIESTPNVGTTATVVFPRERVIQRREAAA